MAILYVEIGAGSRRASVRLVGTPVLVHELPFAFASFGNEVIVGIQNLII